MMTASFSCSAAARRARLGRPLAFLLLLLIATEVPYVLAYRQGEQGMAFSGMLWCPHDFAQYSAAMQEAASQQSWLVYDHLTSEPHRPVAMYSLYVALGKLAALTGLAPQLIYHLAELTARATLMLSIYGFALVVFAGASQARAALVLTLTGSGIQVWARIGRSLSGSNNPLVGYYPEFSTFLTLFTAPHLMLGLALALAVFSFYALAWRNAGRGWPASAAASNIALGFVNPFGLVPVLVPLLSHLVAIYILHHTAPRRAAQAAGLVATSALPFVCYSYVVFGRDPFWRVAYGIQSYLPSPDAWQLLLLCGALGALALAGLHSFLLPLTSDRLLVLTIVTASLGLMYIPVPYQRRFAFCLYPCLGILGATGWTALSRRFSEMHTPLQRVLRFASLWLLGAALFGDSAELYVRLVTVAIWSQGGGDATFDLYYQAAPVLDAGRKFAEGLTDEDVVLAEPTEGNWLARWGRGRVLVGHPVGTLNYSLKSVQAHSFIADTESSAERSSLLDRYHVRYVFYGPRAQALGGRWLFDDPRLHPILAEAGVWVFAVAPMGSGIALAEPASR